MPTEKDPRERQDTQDPGTKSGSGERPKPSSSADRVNAAWVHAQTDILQTPTPQPAAGEDNFDPFVDMFHEPQKEAARESLVLVGGKIKTPHGHIVDLQEVETLWKMLMGRQKTEEQEGEIRSKLPTLIDDMFEKNTIEVDMEGNISKLDLTGRYIFSKNLAKFPALKVLVLARCSGVKDMSFVESLLNLEWLDVSGNFLPNLKPLQNLKQLRALYLANTHIQDITPLRDLRSLQYLDISYNHNLEDVEALSELENLEYLNLACTKVQKLPSLKKLARLKTLILAGTNIGTLDALEDLPDGDTSVLEEVNIANTEVEDLKMLTRFSASLKRLNGNDTKVKSFKPLSRLQALEELRAIGCEVEDISPLRENKKLRVLDFRQTNVSDLAPLKELADLEELYIGYTKVTDLYPLHFFRKLKVLDVSWLKVANITPIGECQELDKLFLTAIGAEWQKEFMADEGFIPRGIESQFLSKETVDEIITLLPRLRWLEMPGYSKKYGNGQFFGEILAAYQRELGIPEELIVRPGPKTPLPQSFLPGAGRTGRLTVPPILSPVALATPTGAITAARRERRQKADMREKTHTPSSIISLTLLGVLVILGLGVTYTISAEFRQGVQRILGGNIVEVVSSQEKNDTGEIRKPSVRKRRERDRLKHEKRPKNRSASRPSVAAKGPSRRVESPQPAFPDKRIEAPHMPFKDTFTITLHFGESLRVEVKGVEGSKKYDDFDEPIVELTNDDRVKIVIHAKKGGRSYTGVTYIETHGRSEEEIKVKREIEFQLAKTTKPRGIEEGPPAEEPRVTDQEERWDDEVPEEDDEEEEE